MALLSFGVSVNIYTDLRGYDHGLFGWADKVFPIDLSLLGDTFTNNDFVLYNLPDGLWILSLFFLLIAAWDANNKSYVVPWLIVGLVLAYFLEVLQYHGMIVGTFDVMDIMTYSLTFLLTLIFYLLQKSHKWKAGKNTYFHS